MSLVSVEELRTWANLSVTDDASIQMAIDAVETHLDSFYSIPATPVSDLTIAIMMQASRIIKRAESPLGIIPVFEAGVRVTRFDPDIEMLLAPYVNWGVFG